MLMVRDTTEPVNAALHPAAHTLVGGIDDATGTVPWALFREQEDAHGYLLWLAKAIRRDGIPLAL